MIPQITTWRLNNYWRKWFCEKDNFLMHAERYMKENGTEDLEKLIANKNTMCRPDAEATNEIIATDNKEMLKTYGERLQYLTRELDLVQTNGERLQVEHNDIKDLEAIEKKEIPANKQDIPVMPKIGRSQNASSATVETKGTAEINKAGGEVSQSSTQKEVQKEWTCALCLVTTSSEKTLNCHLGGKKHRASVETLISKKQPTLQKQKDAKVTNKIIATGNKEIAKTNGERLQTKNKDIKDLEAIEKKEIPATKQINYPNIVASQKASSAIAETRGTEESDKASGKVPQSSTSTQKGVQEKWTCALCSVTTTSKKDLNSHLNGRKHRDASEAALKAKNQLALQKQKVYQSKEEVKQLNVSNKLNFNVKNGADILNKGLKGTVMMDDKVQKLQKTVQKLQKNLCEPVGMHNSKLICSVCNVVLHCEANLVSHLNGKMHLAKMQSKVDSLNILQKKLIV